MNLMRLRHSQKGFVLATSLLLLVVLTILGVSIMGTNTLTERMTGYFIDRQIALQAAEAALRDAERDILFSGRISGTTGFVEGCGSSGLCLMETDGTPIWVDLERAGNEGWMLGNPAGPSVAMGTYTNLSGGPGLPPGVAATPRYVIEALTIQSLGSLRVGFGPQTNSIVYRVTAVGFGRQKTTRIMLQAIYKP